MLIDEIRSDFTQLQSDIADGPILPTVTAEEVRTYLGSRYDFQQTLPLEEVVNDVEKMLRTWQVQVTHPRYFGLFNPSVTLASVVADTLVAMYNSQLANWRTSPAANEIERHTLGWLAEKFGLPRNGIATFTTGGTEANLSAMVVALTRALPRLRRTRSSPPERHSLDLSDCRGPSRLQQDRSHDGPGTESVASDRDRQRSEDGSE